jgi:hypothetical protein
MAVGFGLAAVGVSGAMDGVAITVGDGMAKATMAAAAITAAVTAAAAVMAVVVMAVVVDMAVLVTAVVADMAAVTGDNLPDHPSLSCGSLQIALLPDQPSSNLHDPAGSKAAPAKWAKRGSS